MPRAKAVKAAPKGDREGGYVTVQVPVAVRKILKLEQAEILRHTDQFKGMGEILVKALADHFSDRPEYMKILREAGLLD
jgi:hypothetical protein